MIEYNEDTEEFRYVFGPYDRIDENPDNYDTFWGKDDENGYTTWYDSDGNLDSVTETPSRFDQYQRKLEYFERYHYKTIRRDNLYGNE